MSITIFNDVLLPDGLLAAGVRGKQMRRNIRTEMANGEMQINIGWNKTLRQYELGTVPLTVAQWQTLEGLHEVTEGGAYGFLMTDPKDTSCTTGQLQGYLASGFVGAAGTGYGCPVLKLFKSYSVAGSSRTKTRQITRPKSTGLVVKRNGSPVTVGSSPGNIAIDYDTGTVTFVNDTNQSVASITIGASTVLNFSDGLGMVAALGVGDRVYITGVSGTAATVLNDRSHRVSSKGATSLTIEAVTTGLTVTSPGIAKKYPQGSDALTWTGSFYVPVHFENDQIDWELVVAGAADSRYLAGPSVLLTEVRE